MDIEHHRKTFFAFLRQEHPILQIDLAPPALPLVQRFVVPVTRAIKSSLIALGTSSYCAKCIV